MRSEEIKNPLCHCETCHYFQSKPLDVGAIDSGAASATDVKMALTNEPPADVIIEQKIKAFKAFNLEIPSSIGSDNEAVTWVNTCIKNVFSSPTLTSTLTQLWMDAMTAYIDSFGVIKHSLLPFDFYLIT